MVQKQEPKIEIDDLAPKDTIGGYRATWKQDDVAAHIDLLPLQDQPARGFVLEVYTSNKSGRPMGKRQQERADELIPLVKARMLDAMQIAGWQVVRQLENPPMDVWKHCPVAVLSGQKELDSVTQQEKPIKTIEQYQERLHTLSDAKLKEDQNFMQHMLDAGAQPAKASLCLEAITQEMQERLTVTPERQKTLFIPAKAERRQSTGYTRTITAQPVTFACLRCGLEATKLLYPGAKPLYCDGCAKEVEREKTRARVARLRAGRKAGKEVHS